MTWLTGALAVTLLANAAPLTTGEIEARDVSAAQKCGYDRRCRLRRLEQRGLPARAVETLPEEKTYEDAKRREQALMRARVAREEKEIALAYRVSRLGMLGVVGSYTLAGRVRFEAWLSHSSDTVYGDSLAARPSLDGDLALWWLGTAITWLPLDRRVTPYLSLGWRFARGTYQDYGFGGVALDAGSDGGTVATPRGDDQTVRVHAPTFAAGLELQFFSGFVMRLGVAWAPPVYVQAQIDAGAYDEIVRQGMESFYRSDFEVDVVWEIGWAF